MVGKIKNLFVVCLLVVGLTGCVVVPNDEPVYYYSDYVPYPVGSYEWATDYYHRPPRYRHRIHHRGHHHMQHHRYEHGHKGGIGHHDRPKDRPSGHKDHHENHSHGPSKPDHGSHVSKVEPRKTNLKSINNGMRLWRR